MTFRTTAIQIADVYEYSYLILGLLGLLFTVVRKQYKWILFFLLIEGVLRIVSIYLAVNSINSIPIYHVLGVVELGFAGLIYRKYAENKLWRYFGLGLALLYCIYSFSTSIWVMNGIAHAVVQLFIFALTVNYLFKLYSDSNKISKSIPNFFFINAGFMFYAAGSFLVFIINESFIDFKNKLLFDSAWLIEAGFGIFRLLFIFYRFYTFEVWEMIFTYY